MIRHAWPGWVPLIYTDNNTFKNNMNTFKLMIFNGAIIVITTIQYEEFNKKAILRLNRFYPLFMEGVKCPVFIRDADTIFEYQMAKIMVSTQNKLKPKHNYSNYLTYKKITLAKQNIIFHEFIEKIHYWESAYYNKVKDYSNKIVFSYDNNYYFEKDGEKHVRIMAGVVSKIGEPLPIDLWNNRLLETLETYMKQIGQEKEVLIEELYKNHSITSNNIDQYIINSK